MEPELLGWPEDEVTLRLDFERFSYAGKFVMPSTGKAVVRDPESPLGTGSDDEFDRGFVAATAFSEDRTDDRTLWIRYLTVRRDHRGEGLGPRLASFVVDRARERGYECVKIAVNNPFAYGALYRAGFAYTGEQTGLAELVLSTNADRSTARYQQGFEVYSDRENLSDAERAYVDAHRDESPPDPLH